MSESRITKGKALGGDCVLYIDGKFICYTYEEDFDSTRLRLLDVLERERELGRRTNEIDE